MRIAFVGHGNVGGALAVALARHGHEVTLAARDPGAESVRKALSRHPALRVASPSQAVGDAEVVFLATPFPAVADALKPIEASLAGKVLVDCTNPVGPGVTHGLGSRQSGSQLVQSLVPAARVVKAFGIYGFENFEDPPFPGVDPRPVMMFCGDDAAAKAVVAGIVRQLGWEPLDVGGMEQALHLEHMTLLWVRMVRLGGRSPRTAWAMLGR
jgi:hypothetical protein